MRLTCSKTKLGGELDKIQKLLIENGYPAVVLLSCINQKLANVAAEKPVGPEKCLVYLKLFWVGNVSSEFEDQVSKAITSCYYAVKPCVVYNTRVMLLSAKNDCVPTTQKCCVVYEFSCRCNARYVRRTTQRLADRIKQHVPTSIRKKGNTIREQPPRICKTKNSEITCESATPYCKSRMHQNIYRRQFSDHWASKIIFHFSVWNLSTSRLKTHSCVDKKSLVFLIGTLQVNNDNRS